MDRPRSLPVFVKSPGRVRLPRLVLLELSPPRALEFYAYATGYGRLASSQTSQMCARAWEGAGVWAVGLGGVGVWVCGCV